MTNTLMLLNKIKSYGYKTNIVSTDMRGIKNILDTDLKGMTERIEWLLISRYIITLLP